MGAGTHGTACLCKYIGFEGAQDDFSVHEMMGGCVGEFDGVRDDLRLQGML